MSRTPQCGQSVLDAGASGFWEHLLALEVSQVQQLGGLLFLFSTRHGLEGKCGLGLDLHLLWLRFL